MPHHSCSAAAVRDRRGITLYEVVLALAIFVTALAALAQSITTGSRAAVASQMRTEAILRCESKLADIIVGIEKMEPVAEKEFIGDSTEVSGEGADNWRWSLQLEQGPHPELLILHVSVFHNVQSDVHFSLTRYLYVPEPDLDSTE
jgi:type II secretion system protein I